MIKIVNDLDYFFGSQITDSIYRHEAIVLASLKVRLGQSPEKDNLEFATATDFVVSMLSQYAHQGESFAKAMTVSPIGRFEELKQKRALVEIIELSKYCLFISGAYPLARQRFGLLTNYVKAGKLAFTWLSQQLFFQFYERQMYQALAENFIVFANLFAGISPGEIFGKPTLAQVCDIYYTTANPVAHHEILQRGMMVAPRLWR